MKKWQCTDKIIVPSMVTKGTGHMESYLYTCIGLCFILVCCNKKDILIGREVTKNQNDVTIIKSRPEDLNVDAMLIATKDEVSGELVVRGSYGNKRSIKSFKDMLLFGDMRLIKKQSNIQGVVFIGMLHNSQVTSGMNSYIGEFSIYDGQVTVVTEDGLESLFSINELLEFIKRKSVGTPK